MCPKNFLTFILLIGFLGCSTTDELIDDITKPDYVNSSKAKKLEVPPDLSELESTVGYNVPGEAKSYKEFLDREKNLADQSVNSNRKKLIKNPEGMKIVKSGNLRWLVVEKEPEIIWPHVKEFWEDLGFRVLIANRQTGIIETEWMNTDDIKIDRNAAGVLSRFDKWLDSISGFTDKRKFRTRVEFGERGSTEIYISQRSAEAAADQHNRILEERKAYNQSSVYKIQEYISEDKPSGKKIEISEQREIDDYEIDSELLSRLMIKLGATDFDAQEKVSNPEIVVKAELVKTDNDVFIKMNDPYDRAWRRLGLALDIIGFVTEDKNRSEGIYFVRFNQVELPSEKQEDDEGLLDSLVFWDDDKDFEGDSDNEKTSSIDKNKNADEINYDPNEPTFTGIEAPEVKPLDEDYIPDEYSTGDALNQNNEETWVTKLWPSWGDADERNTLPKNEQRYRIRIKPSDDGKSTVFIDYSNGKRSNSKSSIKVLSIINEYLK